MKERQSLVVGNHLLHTSVAHMTELLISTMPGHTE